MALHAGLLLYAAGGGSAGRRGPAILTVTLHPAAPAQATSPLTASADVSAVSEAAPSDHRPAPEIRPAAAPEPVGVPAPAGMEGRYLRQGEYDRPPMPLNEIVPAFPEEAFGRYLGGQVEVEVWVDRDGAITQVHVVSSRPEGVFDASALRAVREFRFAPAVYRGKAVGGILRATIEYALP